ncbi:hypothetical protein [Stetteria hydrogenophila]
MGLKLVGVVGSLASEYSLCLAEEASRLHGSRLGCCVVVDAGVDALNLLSMAEEHGADEIVLVFACPRCREDERIVVKPEAEKYTGDPDLLVRTLWPNLTGVLDADPYIDALRVLSKTPVVVYKLRESGSCREGLGRVLEAECGVAGPDSGGGASRS